MTYDEAAKFIKAHDDLLNRKYRDMTISAIVPIPKTIEMPHFSQVSQLLRDGFYYPVPSQVDEFEAYVFFNLADYKDHEPPPVMYLSALLHYMEHRNLETA